MQPTSAAEVAEAVRDCARVLPHGARSKPALSVPAEAGVRALDLTRLRGMVEYEPTEYLFTALAGTTLREVAEVLAQHGQYLPFDPPLVQAGATLGGTVAAAMSGAGRVRFGGVRDFLCAVKWVDGRGTLVRGGARVVKNAAGFDFPKLFTGSCGRLGVLVELSFKVFPQPPSKRSLEIICPDAEEATARMAQISCQPWDVEALECLPGRGGEPVRLIARFMGNPPALAKRVPRIQSLLGLPSRVLDETEATAFWSEAAEFSWAGSGSGLVKVPVSPRGFAPLLRRLATLDVQVRVSMAGNLVVVAGEDGVMNGPLDRVLEESGLTGMRLRGAGAIRPGLRAVPEAETRIKAALDPDSRFLPLI